MHLMPRTGAGKISILASPALLILLFLFFLVSGSSDANRLLFLAIILTVVTILAWTVSLISGVVSVFVQKDRAILALLAAAIPPAVLLYFVVVGLTALISGR